MKSWNASIALAGVLFCLPFPALGQQPPTSAPSDPIERFLGTWELHMKEAPPGVPERESLSIERTEKGTKITHLVAFDNGTVLHYCGVMDPKGSFVKMIQTNGEPMNEEWRIVSVNADALVIETRPFGAEHHYKLSADGQTMKMHRQKATLMSFPPLPDLTFQKSK
jgi:hypothetical protein